MKKIFTSIFFIFIAGFIFAQNLGGGKSHSFEFKISDLTGKGFYDEIKIRNDSSYELRNIHITISINGKSIKLLPIANLQPDMHDELRYFFGNDGKLSRTNHNTITFDIDFGGSNEKILVKDFFIKNKDLYFSIEDNPAGKSSAQTAGDSAKIVIIDGKRYILVDDKAFEIQ